MCQKRAIEEPLQVPESGKLRDSRASFCSACRLAVRG